MFGVFLVFVFNILVLLSLVDLQYRVSFRRTAK